MIQKALKSKEKSLQIQCLTDRTSKTSKELNKNNINSSRTVKHRNRQYSSLTIPHKLPDKHIISITKNANNRIFKHDRS
jgi:hypothetical protein